MDNTHDVNRPVTAVTGTGGIITTSQLEAWVGPALLAGGAVPENLWEKLAAYIQILLRWNARMNLTAVRDAEELARVHLAECLRCGQLLPGAGKGLPGGIRTLLDFGSGAGLPGIPMQLMRPEMAVTLAESQGKKAGFLREAVRVLGLERATVYGGRVEAMPPAQQFDAVALRAVDGMEGALRAGVARIAEGGWCVVLTTEGQAGRVRATLPELEWREAERMPGSRERVVLMGQRTG